MKQILLILTLFLAFETYAQKHFECSDTIDFKVRVTASDFINNAVRYQIEISDTVFESGIANCPNTWGILDTATVWKSDVGKNGRNFLLDFGTLIFYIDNPLKLNLNKCAIKQD